MSCRALGNALFGGGGLASGTETQAAGPEASRGGGVSAKRVSQVGSSRAGALRWSEAEPALPWDAPRLRAPPVAGRACSSVGCSAPARSARRRQSLLLRWMLRACALRPSQAEPAPPVLGKALVRSAGWLLISTLCACRSAPRPLPLAPPAPDAGVPAEARGPVQTPTPPQPGSVIADVEGVKVLALAAPQFASPSREQRLLAYHVSQAR